MTYYDNQLMWYRVDGKNRRLVEQQAEVLADEGHDVVALEDIFEDWVPDEDLDCTCGPDLPDGRTGYVCWLHSQLTTDDIPF